ncbi:PIN-like domain-containing protein [Mycobacterium sp.]|uniref:PIN-like domain-containing protein n=1 Tax=Mycobacterium sp. TaxID=1785 RepID=UPI0025DC6A0E|nr:PIN-like domain-containing protein [Mycobacterium sp.]
MGTDDMRSALQAGIIAVDTNVLLNLYRYNEQTVADLLGVLAAAKERLFVPHQVIREFWRNRQFVLCGTGGATKDVHAALQKNSASTQNAIRQWAKSVALSEYERNEMEGHIETFFAQLRDRIGEEPTRVRPDTPTGQDRMLNELERVLQGAVGEELSSEEWDNAVAEGQRRAESSVPPGYMDVDKLDLDLEEGASGDYLVWYQLIKEGRRAKQDLILVTADVKEDWWNRAERGVKVGPRVELITEYLHETGCRFYLLEPSDLLKHSSALGVGTSEESLQDVERVHSQTHAQVSWTLEAITAVLSELETQGHPQAEVIREAVENNGRISRERVYEIDGRDHGQMLRGFTKPVKRVTTELQERGDVPFGVVPLLRAVYEAGVKSSHFAVPSEVVELLATADRDSQS